VTLVVVNIVGWSVVTRPPLISTQVPSTLGSLVQQYLGTWYSDTRYSGTLLHGTAVRAVQWYSEYMVQWYMVWYTVQCCLSYSVLNLIDCVFLFVVDDLLTTLCWHSNLVIG